MKYLKKILLALLAVLLLAFAGLYIYYHSYSAEKKDIEVNEANLKYFSEDYDSDRQACIASMKQAKVNFDNIEISHFKVDSDRDSNLYMDLCYIPPTNDTNRLLVLISGTHGVEGYTGSAIQRMFLEEILNEELIGDMGILMVHAYNPFGFKYNRKATEYSIDLNRNNGKESTIFNKVNKGYTYIYDLLTPAGSVNTGSLNNQFFYLVAISNIIRKGMATLRQAALQGQYEYSEGIYYGGKDFAPQTKYLQEVLPGYFSQYDKIFAVDLHTGYGEWGKLHLFPNPIEDKELKASTESLFGGYHIDWGDGDDFYTIDGAVEDYLKVINPNALTLTMLFEYGTLDSQNTIGSLVSIHRMILENQGYNNGYKNKKAKQKVQDDFREMYYPSSPAWRSEVIRQTREVLGKSVTNFLELE